VTSASDSAVFRMPLGPRLLSAFGFAVCAALAAVLLAACAFCVLRYQFGLAAALAAAAAFQVALARYVGRDLRGKWGLRAELTADRVLLQLPAGRSLIHRLPAASLSIPYADIAAIETRLEGYRSLGMAMLQRAYALRRRSGELIFLGEDRAVGSALAAPHCAGIVAAIAERIHVAPFDLGMVEGRGGALGVWGARTVDWDAPSLDEARQRRLWRAASITGYVAVVGALVVLVLSLTSLLR
jgi:hypothetical protein